MEKFEVKEMESRLEMGKWTASLTGKQDFKNGGATLEEKVEFQF